jgi:hypothetical protein
MIIQFKKLDLKFILLIPMVVTTIKVECSFNYFLKQEKTISSLLSLDSMVCE